VGYNTVNVYAYYGLNSIFKTAEIDGEKINMKAFNIGIIFFISYNTSTIAFVECCQKTYNSF
jgi:hypothetical protein